MLLASPIDFDGAFPRLNRRLRLGVVGGGRVSAMQAMAARLSDRWDIAAGALLVKEAGGLVADIDASDNYLESGNIVCGNPKCFKAVLQTTKPLLG